MNSRLISEIEGSLLHETISSRSEYLWQKWKPLETFVSGKEKTQSSYLPYFYVDWKVFMYHLNVLCIFLIECLTRFITSKIKRHIYLTKRIDSLKSEICFVICHSKKDLLVEVYKTYPRNKWPCIGHRNSLEYFMIMLSI